MEVRPLTLEDVLVFVTGADRVAHNVNRVCIKRHALAVLCTNRTIMAEGEFISLCICNLLLLLL